MSVLRALLRELGELLEQQEQPRDSYDEVADLLGCGRDDLETIELGHWTRMGRTLLGLWMVSHGERIEFTLAPCYSARQSYQTVTVSVHPDGRANTREAVSVGATLRRPDSGAPYVLALNQQRNELHAWCAKEHITATLHDAEQLHRELHDRNPMKGQVIAVSDKQLEVIHLPRRDRSTVIQPPGVWATLDTQLHGFVQALPRLERAGLPTRRGVLLQGPPGCGKTAMVNVLAGELAGQTTILLPDSDTINFELSELYRTAAELAPAVVVLEDIDLLASGRNGDDSTLQELLVALDGAGDLNRQVITLATTNAADHIDPAARRSCRFDIELQISTPDAVARGQILTSYLQRLEIGPLDLGETVAATDGFSGADLTSLVVNALLEPGGLTDSLLANLACQQRERVATIAQAASW